MRSSNDFSKDTNLLMASEVASRLRLPLTTVYFLAKKGEIPAFQVGRSWRFREKDIQRIENSRNVGARIMIVDEDEVFRKLVKDALESRGCLVIQTTHVEEALEINRKQRFEVFLIDLKMLKRNGSHPKTSW